MCTLQVWVYWMHACMLGTGGGGACARGGSTSTHHRHVLLARACTLEVCAGHVAEGVCMSVGVRRGCPYAAGVYVCPQGACPVGGACLHGTLEQPGSAWGTAWPLPLIARPGRRREGMCHSHQPSQAEEGAMPTPSCVPPRLQEPLISASDEPWQHETRRGARAHCTRHPPPLASHRPLPMNTGSP